MAFKSLNIRGESRGIAHLLLIVAAVLVVGGVAGAVYWRVDSYNNKKDTEGGKEINASATSADGKKANTADVSDECVKQTGDEIICRLGAITDLSNFSSIVTMTMEGGDGPVTYTIKYDGKGNSYVDLGGGSMGMTVDGKTYVYTMDKWYDAGGDKTQAPKGNVPSMGFATTAGIKYENQGKEACGKDTCYKYRMSGGLLADGVVTATIGEKDYLPRKIDSTGGLIGKLSMSVEYTDVTITAPAGAVPISSMGADLAN